MAGSTLVKRYKYFVSFSFIDENGNTKFDNLFTIVKCKIAYSSVLKTITKEIEEKQNLKDVVILNFQMVCEL